MAIMVTGGAGFIGSNFVIDWFKQTDEPVINVDKLTYAGNLHNLDSLLDHPGHHFLQADICDREEMRQIVGSYRPRAILNFAAESHVDRSIADPRNFIETNICGLFTLLDIARDYWDSLPEDRKARFRFVQISTDEVFGSLAQADAPFAEDSNYAPNSPYSASKASADFLTRAYNRTYGLPTIVTNCSNNYGPYQFPEKLIPLVIHNCLKKLPIPVYGDGRQIRDWLYVGDHCAALRLLLEKGMAGENYVIGGRNEVRNIDMVRTICRLVDSRLTPSSLRRSEELITFVADRPGHDTRYAIDGTKIETTLGWMPEETIETGLARTVDWYLSNSPWVTRVTSGDHRDWVEHQYAS
ncbi:dTDP-glucose 4,6-dehydratase [Roseibium sp.]|uniref:dTDP-glucose 4,6-dehydratase n=1 Tax=Roseibium sp. TaxID=1936156 RepID=UPI003BAFE8D5